MQSLWDLDHELFRAVHLGCHRDWLDPVFWVVSATGLGWMQFLFVVASFLRVKPGPEGGYGKHFFRVALPLISVWALSGLIGTVWLKQAVQRDRPSNLAFAHAFEALDKVPKLGSFPSGHTATAFGIATVLWFLLSGYRKAFWGSLVFLWAISVGASRIYLGVHWPTDVIAGAAIGIFSGCAVAFIFGMTRKKKESEKWPRDKQAPANEKAADESAGESVDR